MTLFVAHCRGSAVSFSRGSTVSFSRGSASALADVTLTSAEMKSWVVGPIRMKSSKWQSWIIASCSGNDHSWLRPVWGVSVVG